MFDKSTKEIKVGGMMCDHCSAAVKKAVESVEVVKSADVELKKGVVKVKYKGEFPEEAIKKAVEEAGYTYGGTL